MAAEPLPLRVLPAAAGLSARGMGKAGPLGAPVIGPLAQFATAMHISTRPLAATAAQPDHRVRDLPREDAVKRPPAGPHEALTPWLV
ncbi:hypothetical protein GCM10023324_30400 [Streptomyces youssoufiensis]